MPQADTPSTRLASAASGFTTVRPASAASIRTAARAYFASDASRAIQTSLGLIWLLDGALQFQSFMYSKGFIHVITALEVGQPHWLASSIKWAAHISRALPARSCCTRSSGY